LVWCRQGSWVDDLADLAGEVFGGGTPEADGEGDVVATAAESDEPDVPGGSAAAAGGAGVDLDLEGFVSVGVVGAWAAARQAGVQ